MLVMTKQNQNLSDSVDTNNEFAECFHANWWSMFCDVRLCYRLMAVAAKAMHTTNTNNNLLESLPSDV